MARLVSFHEGTQQCEIGADSGPKKSAITTRMLVVRRQFATEPGPGVRPLSLDGPRGNALKRGDFVNGHAREDPQLDDLGRVRIDAAELRERFIQIQNLIIEREIDPIVFG